MMNTRILLVIDESKATKRAVAYVARLVGRRRGIRLCPGHILLPLPPRSLEFGGAENPVDAQQAGKLLAADRQQ